MSMKEGLPASRHPKRLFVPVVSSVIALLALACSNGADQNSTQRNYPDRSPELNAFFANLEKTERQVSPPKNAQLSSSVWQQPTSTNVKVIYDQPPGYYRAIWTSKTLTPDGKVVTTMDFTLGQKKCTALESTYIFENLRYLTNENKPHENEVLKSASAKSREIKECNMSLVNAFMTEFLNRAPQ